MLRAAHLLQLVFIVCFAGVVACILAVAGLLPAVCILGAAIWMVRRRLTIPRFTWILLGVGIFARVLIVVLLDPPIASDFKVLYEASRSLLAGDSSFQESTYFSLWAYQSVFVAWQSLFLALWNHPLMLKLVNALLSAGTVCLLYRIARGVVRESAAQAMALLLTVFPFALTLPAVLTNQISSAFFLVLGVWLLVSPDCQRLRLWRFPLAGLALQMGNLLRNEGIIVLVAVLAYLLFEFLRHPDQGKRLLCGLALLLSVYIAFGFGVDAAVRGSGLNENGIANGLPGWKLVTGLNADTGGTYSEEDWQQLKATFDENGHPTDATIALQNQLIRQRLGAGPRTLLLLEAKKARALWHNDALNWALGHLEKTYLFRVLIQNLRALDRLLFYSALLLSVAGLVLQGRRRELPAKAYLPQFVMFAAVCAFLLVEVQARYAYLPQLFLFCGAALGLDLLTGEK